MVRNRKTSGAKIANTLGVVDAAHTLDHKWSVPLRTQPRNVFPTGRRHGHPLVVRTEERWRLLTGVGHVRRAEIGKLAGLEIGKEPLGPRKRLRRQLDHRLEIELLGDPGAAPVATVGEGPVQRQDDSLGTGGLGALETLHHDIAATAPVHLEEQLRVHRSNVFHRTTTERTKSHRNAAVCRSASNGYFTLGVNGLHASGRNDDGH